MCIAILKTKKGIITDEALRNSFQANNDGAGIAYTVNNQLVIEKGIFDENEFVNKVRNAEAICDSNMLIHCRIGTSGTMDEYNTHPFLVNQNVCLIHNGVLHNIDVPFTSRENDTQLFIKEYLYNIKESALMHDKNVHRLIGNMIGAFNKFVLLDNKGYYKIINEEAGTWENDVWYSNDSYKTKQYRFVYWDNEQNNIVDLEKVYGAIDQLNEEDFIEMGWTPIYDVEHNELISKIEYEKVVNLYNYGNFKPLRDVDGDAYSYYLDVIDYLEERKEDNEYLSDYEEDIDNWEYTRDEITY